MRGGAVLKNLNLHAMTHINSMNAKNTSFRISDQVKEILHSKGLSKVFNYQDYEYFKNQCRTAFNKVQAIADLFIEYYSDTPTDYNDYVF